MSEMERLYYLRRAVMIRWIDADLHDSGHRTNPLSHCGILRVILFTGHFNLCKEQVR